MAAAGEEEASEVELEVAAILCDLKRILRARDRRWRRPLQREREAAPEIPSWGRRRLRSVLEDSKPAIVAAAPAAAERDGAASPDTPLAFPESDAAEEDDDAKKAARTHAEWVQQQQGVVASLSQENAHLLKQIEEYRARLQSSRSANESLKQLHKVRQMREQEQEQARKLTAQARPALDLNEPAPEDAARTAAAEWYRRGQALQRAAMQRAAATAEARRRRLEILRAKVGSPLLSCRTRRAAGASTAGSSRG